MTTKTNTTKHTRKMLAKQTLSEVVELLKGCDALCMLLREHGCPQANTTAREYMEQYNRGFPELLCDEPVTLGGTVSRIRFDLRSLYATLRA